MRPTYIMENDLLYSKSTDFNVNYIFKNTLPTRARLVFDQTPGHQSLISQHIKSIITGVIVKSE